MYAHGVAVTIVTDPTSDVPKNMCVDDYNVYHKDVKDMVRNIGAEVENFDRLKISNLLFSIVIIGE